MPLERREWDSSFFGYPVAAASWDAAPLLSDVCFVLQQARRSGIKLLYLFMAPVSSSLRAAIEQEGAKSVGRKVEYSKPIIGPNARNLGKDISLCHESTPQLESLALQSGIHSRFRLDDGFQQQEFERLYREWLASSLRGDDDKRVYVAGGAAAPRGMITLEPSGTMARIGLFAIDAAHQGRGLGRQFVAAAEQFCIDTGRIALLVATQAENQGACRFYETCGFSKISEVDHFHAWLAPNNGLG